VDPIDFIGDVHGCGEKLLGLLRTLGYDDGNGAFRHPDRTAIFVGDLIDRGLQQVEVLSVVRSMVEAGSAQVLMGNHEFNAISYVTPDPSGDGAFMRPRSGLKGPKNRQQHAEFLRQIGENSVLHCESIAWFKTLPLCLDLGDVRVVHACWHDLSIEALGVYYEPGRPLPDEFFVRANTHEDPLYKPVDTLLKGPEVALGADGPYVDKEGQERSDARIRWWDTSATTLRELAEIPSGSLTPGGEPLPMLPNRPEDSATRFRYSGDVPVFFGHYWFAGTPRVAGPRTACLDYSAVRGGPLVAYRWEGETELIDQHLVGFGKA
jgi:Calcineurin-like phosphoesterase